MKTWVNSKSELESLKTELKSRIQELEVKSLLTAPDYNLYSHNHQLAHSLCVLCITNSISQDTQKISDIKDTELENLKTEMKLKEEKLLKVEGKLAGMYIL